MTFDYIPLLSKYLTMLEDLQDNSDEDVVVEKTDVEIPLQQHWHFKKLEKDAILFE